MQQEEKKKAHQRCSARTQALHPTTAHTQQLPLLCLLALALVLVVLLQQLHSKGHQVSATSPHLLRQEEQEV